MLSSTVRGDTPTPLLALPCGSRSTRSVLRSAAATLAARFTAVVVFPTPPFWLTTAMTRGREGMPVVLGRGSGRLMRGANLYPPSPRAATVTTAERKSHGAHSKYGPFLGAIEVGMYG